MDDLCSFIGFNIGDADDEHSSSNDDYLGTKELNEGKEVQFSGAEGWGDSGGTSSLCSNFGFNPDDISEEGYLLSPHQQKDLQQMPDIDYETLDNLQFDMVPPLLQDNMNSDQLPSMVPVSESINDKPCSLPLASLELLNNYGCGFKRLNGERNFQTVDDSVATDVERKLSTEDIIRIAGKRFIQSSSESVDFHPYDSCFSRLSHEEKEDVELAESLLASAEKIAYQQFERASTLLNHCESLSSKTGTAVKRVVAYFSDALRERLHRETGRISAKVLSQRQSFDPDQAMKSPNPTSLACHAKLPFCQVSFFCEVQAIIDNSMDAKKIHIIDFAIKDGVNWSILMQALESRHNGPVELLKITAVGTTSKHLLEDVGKRLMNFAQTMNIPFSFKIVMVSNMLDLNKDLFEIDPEETIVVSSHFRLKRMLSQPDHLESVMKVIQNIKPAVMVVTEVEANHNATSFVNRFTETLFYFSAYFDCLDTCMKKDDANRMILESVYFGHGIRNIVAMEGDERKIRNVKIDVWRAFFERFGMVEKELSMSSLYQAELVAKRFACGSSCTFEMNGNCLLIGWKGTPLHSLSVWEFLDDD
ncbi:hypothetical protein L6164_013654 [Bauhinia variegata]|uniref:Uncharacterized protein n=1 Tax=Bauhinia variegata TaxID=167791 RepID=A0ACB9NGJ8_BAUVA|nr:hypothetical protein L6164_013654 [Bauhinia variegata]